MMEDMSETEKEGQIQCIFFSEFHADYGPRIVCQVSTSMVEALTQIYCLQGVP